QNPEEIINEVGSGAGGYSAEDYDRLNDIGTGGGAASAAARQGAAMGQARKQRMAKMPTASQYTFDDKKATVVQPINVNDDGRGHFTSKQKVKYQNLSDDDFFKNLEDIRPGEEPIDPNSFEARYEKVAPQARKPQAKPQAKKPQPQAKQPQPSQRQSGAQRKTPIPQRKPAGRSVQPQMTPEEKLRRQKALEEYQKRKRLEAERQKAERPLTLEDIFGDDHK
ncbi:MAG: hypothetical protein KBS66_06965, partial [Eubacterium sp.]|nr:hypothetical protein [Candidatus Colimonas fimequi]